MKKFLFDEESGQGMVEYGLIIALIAIACIAAFSTLGGKISGKASDLSSQLDAAGKTTGGSGSNTTS